MSVNQFRPHVMILPEDDANKDIANGFLLNPAIDSRQVQVLPNAGGWIKLRDCIEPEHFAAMTSRRGQARYMILLVDFDNQPDRLKRMQEGIPSEIYDRVFVIGAKSEPEELRTSKLGDFEEIGRKLAKDCCDSTTNTWHHELLVHNAVEIARMTPTIQRILFPSIHS